MVTPYDIDRMYTALRDELKGRLDHAVEHGVDITMEDLFALVELIQSARLAVELPHQPVLWLDRLKASVKQFDHRGDS